MFDLFNPAPDNYNRVLANNPLSKAEDFMSQIPGLLYIPNFISKEEEIKFIKDVNSGSWLSDIKRRVQHYGYKYDYKARSIDRSMYIDALPNWLQELANRLFHEKHIDTLPDQVIINEYMPGQGITNHVDCEPCFGETIISLSMGSSCIMDFIEGRSKKKIEILLEPCSLVVINGEARHNWSHGIAHRKTDIYKGIRYERELRISMTFRKVILK